MNDAPNRLSIVQAQCAAHPEVFNVPPEQNDDSRRAFLLSTLIPALNLADGGLWGALTKTDQGNFIPADIVVWKPTLEHFDVMTGKGPNWQSDGIITNPAWKWTAVGATPAPQPAPPPPPEPPPSPAPPPVGEFDASAAFAILIEDLERVHEGIANLAESNDALSQRIDALRANGLQIHVKF